MFTTEMSWKMHFLLTNFKASNIRAFSYIFIYNFWDAILARKLRFFKNSIFFFQTFFSNFFFNFFSNFSRTLFWMFIRYSRFHYSFFLLISWQKKMFHVLTKNLPFGNLDRDDFFEECSFSIHFCLLQKIILCTASHV